MTIGLTIEPNNIPSLNQSRFGIVKTEGTKTVNTRKTAAINNKKILISPPFTRGHIPTTKKNSEKTAPKLLLEPGLISLPIFENCSKIFAPHSFSTSYEKVLHQQSLPVIWQC